MSRHRLCIRPGGYVRCQKRLSKIGKNLLLPVGWKVAASFDHQRAPTFFITLLPIGPTWSFSKHFWIYPVTSSALDSKIDEVWPVGQFKNHALWWSKLAATFTPADSSRFLLIFENLFWLLWNYLLLSPSTLRYTYKRGATRWGGGILPCKV